MKKDPRRVAVRRAVLKERKRIIKILVTKLRLSLGWAKLLLKE
ncbi:hypothetical protein LCGC14_0547450 [marine sediment metagenome]|uniref:Uncharacterized protein n=1 Tax=marine sediment metagenome TaxID=412755 RepID=A0A0F9S9K5_9ZZZZ